MGVRSPWLFILLLLLPACGREEHVSPSRMNATFASGDRDEILELIESMRADGWVYGKLLVQNLEHADRGVREWSAHAIGDFAIADDEAVAALVQALEDEDDWVRWKAVRALGMLGPIAKRTLPLLEPIAAAEQEVEVVRAAAQVAVRRIKGE